MIRLQFNERQNDEFKVWLAPAARDWILVGIAEGTAAYNTITGNLETANAADREEGFEQDGRVAFFAKGRIKGDFLLTVAYDSAREKQDARDRLQNTIEPDRYYLLYGDGTEQRFEAASQHKLYLKIERRQFVALFGDFDTGFTVTELTRYNRSLSGVRTDFAGDRVSVSGFAARTDTGLVQDELRGDGTSGLYRLSRSPIVIGSDKLRIEVRDRFELTRVVERRSVALRRLRSRLPARHDLLQGARAESRPCVESRVHRGGLRSAFGRRGSDDRRRARLDEVRGREDRGRGERDTRRRPGWRHAGVRHGPHLARHRPDEGPRGARAVAVG